MRLLIKSTVPMVKIVTVSYPKNDLALGFKKPSPDIMRCKETNTRKTFAARIRNWNQARIIYET